MQSVEYAGKQLQSVIETLGDIPGLVLILLLLLQVYYSEWGEWMRRS